MKTEALADELVDAIAAALATGKTEAVHHLVTRQVERSPKFATLMVASGMRAALHALHESMAREAALEARVKALETTPTGGVHYEGIWDAQKVYGVDTMITHAGSLWAARTANVSRRPGGADGCWQLCCKKGSDGRDGKDGKDGRCTCASEQ